MLPISSNQMNENLSNNQGFHALKFAPSQYSNANPNARNAQVPQLPLRNPLLYNERYNNIPPGYMMNSGFNQFGAYPPYMTFNQEPNDWRNTLTGSSISQHFQNIESLVKTFSSISTMMTATLNAIQSSFFSILTVSENVRQMKSHFGEIYSSLWLIRIIKTALNRLLVYLGIRDRSSLMSTAWSESFSKVGTGASSFPTYAYLLIIYIGINVLTKVFKSVMQYSQKDTWDKGNATKFSAKALYNFVAKKPDELSMTRNQKLKLAPKELQNDLNWCLVSNGRDRGLVPVNFICSTTDSAFT